MTTPYAPSGPAEPTISRVDFDAMAEIVAKLEQRIDELEAQPPEPATRTTDFLARPGQTVVLEPPGAGIKCSIVKATKFNRGETIQFIQRNSNPVVIRAIDGKVNGLAFVTSNAPGTFFAVSDGQTGWLLDQGIGPAGVSGAPGTPADARLVTPPAIEMPVDDDGPAWLIGPPGQTGSAGVTGPAGPAISFPVDDDGPPWLAMPGATGPTGPAGSGGADMPGLPLLVDDDGPPWVAIPGPAGVQGTIGATGAVGHTGSYGGALANGYSFDISTANSAPAPGFVRLSAAAPNQGTSTTIRVADTDIGGLDPSAFFAELTRAQNQNRGYVRLGFQDGATGGALAWRFIDASANLGGWYNITVAPLASAGAAFVAGDQVVLQWGPNADQGQSSFDGLVLPTDDDGPLWVIGPPGATGATGPAGVAGAVTSTAAINLGASPLLSGSFQITGLTGLTVGIPVPVMLAVVSTDPTESEEQIAISGITTSSSVVTCYWQSVDGTPKSGARTVAFITAGSVGFAVGSGNAITVSTQVDLTGSASTINITPTAGALGVVDISTLLCGGTVTIQALAAANLDGFTAKTDGFFFWLIIRDNTTAEYLTINNDLVAVTSVRTPQIRDWRLGKDEAALLVYSNNRWYVANSVSKYWQVSADNVTFAATQNNYTRTLPNGAQSVIRITLTGDQQITGLVPDNNGEILTLLNVDTVDTLTVVNESASSTVANRFSLPGSLDLFIRPGESVTLRYDGTSSRWRPFCDRAATPVASQNAALSANSVTTVLTLASLVVPANTILAGYCFEMFGAMNFVRSAGSGALTATLNLRVNGVITAFYTTALPALAGPAGDASLHGFINFTSIGAAGVAVGRMAFNEVAPAGATSSQTSITRVIDTTAAVTITMECLFSAAVATTVLTGTGGLVQQRARTGSLA